jgi:hypothetical protein
MNATAESMGEQRAEEPKAIPALAGEPAPTIVDTGRGPVEYVACREGQAVLALHGAMGGYDQGLILARTIGEAGYRFVAASRKSKVIRDGDAVNAEISQAQERDIEKRARF